MYHQLRLTRHDRKSDAQKKGSELPIITSVDRVVPQLTQTGQTDVGNKMLVELSYTKTRFVIKNVTQYSILIH